MAQLFTGTFGYLALDANGDPVPGAKVFTYAAGTLTPKTTWTDADETVPATNPVVCDAAGRAKFRLGSGGYRLRATLPDGATLLPDGDIDNIALGSGGATPADGVPLSRFTGADPTGVGDSTAALQAALAAQATDKAPIIIDGRYRYTSQITVSTYGARLVGVAGLSESNSEAFRSESCLIKDFNGQGVVFAGDCQMTDGIQYDSTTGKTGDNVQVIGSRWAAPSIAVTNAGRDGLRIGADTGTNNTNLWHVGRIITRYNGRHGMLVHDQAGLSDAGGGVCLHSDMIGNGGDGIVTDACTWNTFVNAVSQSNVGVGMRITANARAITVVGGDLEGNLGGAQGLIEAGAYSHTICGGFWGSPASWTDSSGLPGRNTVAFYDPAIGAMISGSAVNVSNRASAGAADINLYADTGGDLVATVRGVRGTGTGGKLALRTKQDGDVQVDRLTIDQRGVIALLGARADKAVTLTYGASVAIDASAGTHYTLTATNGTAFAVTAPTNASAGQPVTLTVRNTSGGALGAITWPAVFKMAAWTSPANGFSRSITLRYDGAAWVEEARTPADVPN